VDVGRVFGKDPLGLGGRLPELPELEQGARQDRSPARQIGVEFESASRGRGRLPRPVHPIVDAGRGEVRLGVGGFQFDQPLEFPERSLQLTRLPVGLAPAQEALRIHGQQIDLGAARVALVEQRRQSTCRLGQAPRPVAVAGPVEKVITIETGDPDREANMWIFAERAFQLLEECIRESQQ